jgi:hypothetical protein
VASAVARDAAAAVLRMSHDADTGASMTRTAVARAPMNCKRGFQLGRIQT